jgi:hypothetical protein
LSRLLAFFKSCRKDAIFEGFKRTKGEEVSRLAVCEVGDALGTGRF